MANLNESLKEAMCIEEEIFFGPIAAKERKIREHFVNENNTVESCIVENDISKNDSLYQSFSVDESKYDSFDDSLNEELDKEKPLETKHITLRKSFDKLKAKRHAYYDSLEDVCSLVSNIDKCSISCEVEGNSNCNNKQQVVEDSLKNPAVVVTSKSHGISEQDSLKNPPVAVLHKSHGVNEQIHFDDDSLAILEFENTFDDSLEEINVLSSIEIEEIEDVENMAAGNQNVVLKIEQNSVCVTRNLFDASVEMFCEKKRVGDIADQEESSDDKNLLYDSLSNSDIKDILKDSLEESEKLSEHLNFISNVSGATAFNIQKSEKMPAVQNPFDTSVQIIYENFESACQYNVSEITNSEYNDFSKDSLESFKNDNKNPVGRANTKTATEHDSLSTNVKLSNQNNTTSQQTFEKTLTDANDKALFQDHLEESEKHSENLHFLNSGSGTTAFNTRKSERMLAGENPFDNSVQIICENFQTSCPKNISEITKSEYNDFSKDSLDSFKNGTKTATEHDSLSSNEKLLNQNTVASQTSEKSFIDANYNALISDFNANQDNEIMEDSSVLTKPAIPVSAVDNSSHKETFTVDSCHLKLLNDNINIDNDLKFQLHLEVTVGDKRCQVASQDIQVLPTTNVDLKKCENYPLTPFPVQCPSKPHAIKEKDVLDDSNPKLSINAQECYAAGENILCEATSNEKSESINAANVIRRRKSSQSVSDVEGKFNYPESLSDISLLQALDLHDISKSFLNESVIQSENSLMPLNLCYRNQDIYIPILRDESKENVAQPFLNVKKTGLCTTSKRMSPNKVFNTKTPKQFQKTYSFKDSTKKTPGTKIPVRKIEHFAVPVAASNKPSKQVPAALSAEKVKKCQHSPHVEVGKKTPVTTPNKTPHFCKVRNTIFSKVPQIVPSKKYMNIQSPVAQYIKNNGSGKMPHFDPVLRDCMNRQLESPYHSHHTPKSGTLKSAKKKA